MFDWEDGTMEQAYDMQLKPNGDVLRWCREYQKKTQQEVAERVQISVQDLNDIEEGRKKTSLTLLSKFSTFFQRPVSFFFLDKAPKTELVTPEFRTFDSIEVSELSEKTVLALRKSKYNRELYLELLDRLNQKYVFGFPTVSMEGDPEGFAKKIRKVLEIPEDIHVQLRSKGAALKYWITQLESRGVLVFQYSLPERGFCLHGERELPPAIILSSSEDAVARIFTVFHELTHLLIRDQNNFNYTQAEKFCNHVAGAFLVPKEALYLSSNFERFQKNPESEDHWISRIAGEFKVSNEVIWRRLLILDEISLKKYGQKIKIIKENQARIKKNRDQKAEDSDGFLPPAKKTFLNLGITVSSKLFEAHDRGVLGSAELARSFQGSSKTVEKIKGELSAARNVYDE
jgi:Zn-dependent peptidase ImmA (M78 family)/DNA-binding XRE family transcriptional regulator